MEQLLQYRKYELEKNSLSNKQHLRGNTKHMSKSKSKTKNFSQQTLKQHHGFVLIDLIIVVVIVGIVTSIAAFNILTSRRSANAAATIAAMRTISTSESNYFNTVGNGFYAEATELLKENFIDESLAGASIPTPSNVNQQPKSGYLFFFVTKPASEDTTVIANYSVSARPIFADKLGLNRGGDRSFFVDASGVIRFNDSPIAPFADVNSSPLNR